MPIALRQCPVCDDPMVVRELYCPACDVTIRGEFEPGAAGPFSQLNDEQLAFLHVFVTSRGNMSDVERSLGVSYPTVRSKLDDLISALTEREAPAPPPAPPAPPEQQVITTPPPQTEQEPPTVPSMSRREILAQISEGKLSVQEGMDLMKQLPGE